MADDDLAVLGGLAGGDEGAAMSLGAALGRVLAKFFIAMAQPPIAGEAVPGVPADDVIKGGRHPCLATASGKAGHLLQKLPGYLALVQAHRLLHEKLIGHAQGLIGHVLGGRQYGLVILGHQIAVLFAALKRLPLDMHVDPAGLIKAPALAIGL